MSQRPRAALVADASAPIGAGHVARCTTLAVALAARGWECAIATRQGAPAFPAPGVRIAPMPGESLTDADALAHEFGDVALLVIDNYAATAAFERACRTWARRVLVIDDAPKRAHECDLLLDQNAGRVAADYAGYTAAPVLAGPDYALVAAPFAARREAALARQRTHPAASAVLLSFGATDPANLTARALRELADWPGEVIALLSETAPHRADAVAAAGPRARVIIGASPEEIAGFATAADIALGAAGSSAWERCCLGLPSAAAVVAENQRPIAAALEAAGVALNLGPIEALAPGAFARAVHRLASDAALRSVMVERAAALCDGLGAARVAQHVEPWKA